MESFVDFIKHNPSVKRLRVNELLLAEYQCPLAETRYDIWSHHNYFIYVISGKKKWFTRNQEILAREGDCLFVRKGAHSVYQYFDEDFCAVVLFVPDSFIRSVLVDNKIDPGDPDDFTGDESLYSIEPDSRLSAYFHSFLTYLSGSQLPDSKLMELKFTELLLIIGTAPSDKSLGGYFAQLCIEGKPSLRDVMESSFNYPMSLAEYARLSGRSLSTFKRDFKGLYNTAPARWLNRKRLSLARYLLEKTDKSVTETALDSGFKNNSHFNRVFKDAFGMTPLECRNKARRTSKLTA